MGCGRQIGNALEPGFDDSGMDSVLFFAMIDVWATVALGRRHLICSRQHRQESLRHRQTRRRPRHHMRYQKTYRSPSDT